MPLGIEIVQSARTDLLEVWVYVAEHDYDAADKLVDSILQTVRLLSHQPDMGRDRSSLAVGLRAFPVGKYVIYYTHDAETVTVRRVLHGSRDVDAIL